MRNKTIVTVVASAILAACGTTSSPLGAPAGGQVAQSAPATHGTGNIYWNKRRLHLNYDRGHWESAVLSYWAVDGYFLEPPYCKHGGQFLANPGHSWGNPQKYMHVLFKIRASSPGPDECALTAVLNNTGSPPTATLKLKLN
jgi:hypothetical protein